MTAVFATVFVLAIVVFVAAFVNDYMNDWHSRYARKVGLVAWVTMVVGFIGLIASTDNDEEPTNKVTIECVIGEADALTCEVVE